MSRKNKLAQRAMLARGVEREIQAEEKVEDAVAAAVRRAHHEVYWGLRSAVGRSLELALICAQPRLMQ